MCKHGTTTPVEVSIPASHSHTGCERRATKPIDSCIAEVVRQLDADGYLMAGSCCGHGKREPSIVVIGRRSDWRADGPFQVRIGDDDTDWIVYYARHEINNGWRCGDLAEQLHGTRAAAQRIAQAINTLWKHSPHLLRHPPTPSSGQR